MTDKQPEALRQAAWLKKEGDSCQRHYDLGVLIERQHTELETLRAKLKTYEDLGGAADDMQLLRMGYAAARLEIESLKAQSAGAQPAAQPSYEHQRAIMEGERNASLDAYSRVVSITSAESRLYERAFTSGWDRRDRLASYGQAPAQAGEYPALVCDYCGALTPDPWHSSGMLHGKMSKHIHSCDACCRGAAQAAPQQEVQEPYAYAVYFPDQPKVELVHELDDLIDDLTNRPHVVTKLYTAPQPATRAES